MNKFAKIAMYSLAVVIMMAAPAFAQGGAAVTEDGAAVAEAADSGLVAGLAAGPWFDDCCMAARRELMIAARPREGRKPKDQIRQPRARDRKPAMPQPRHNPPVHRPDLRCEFQTPCKNPTLPATP